MMRAKQQAMRTKGACAPPQRTRDRARRATAAQHRARRSVVLLRATVSPGVGVPPLVGAVGGHMAGGGVAVVAGPVAGVMAGIVVPLIVDGVCAVVVHPSFMLLAGMPRGGARPLIMPAAVVRSTLRVLRSEVAVCVVAVAIVRPFVVLPLAMRLLRVPGACGSCMVVPLVLLRMPAMSVMVAMRLLLVPAVLLLVPAVLLLVPAVLLLVPAVGAMVPARLPVAAVARDRLAAVLPVLCRKPLVVLRLARQQQVVHRILNLGLVPGLAHQAHGAAALVHQDLAVGVGGWGGG
jgi:hypothetical protein